MPGLLRKMVSAACAIPETEASFARRGFCASNEASRLSLERVGRTFVQGYNTALEDEEGLEERLERVEPEFRGFAYEGTAMALTILDCALPARTRRLAKFMEGPGAPHLYMMHVGAGWAFARLPWKRLRLGAAVAALDPLFRWLAIDGFGFHEGYFTAGSAPNRLSGYAARAFDQGFGRSLWFVEGADVDRIALRIAGFDAARHPDLWSGAGLASAYAGGADDIAIARLRCHAAGHWASLAQGAAFAAKARYRAGNPVEHTERACRILCRMSALDASRLTDATLAGLESGSPEPDYEIWRQRIQQHFLLIPKP